MDIDEFPHLKAWDDRMLARPGVEKGRHVPSRHRVKEMSKEEVEKHAQENAKCTYPSLRSTFTRGLEPKSGSRDMFGEQNFSFTPRICLLARFVTSKKPC